MCITFIISVSVVHVITIVNIFIHYLKWAVTIIIINIIVIAILILFTFIIIITIPLNVAFMVCVIFYRNLYIKRINKIITHV